MRSPHRGGVHFSLFAHLYIWGLTAPGMNCQSQGTPCRVLQCELAGNPLNPVSRDTDVPALRARGMGVYLDTEY